MSHNNLQRVRLAVQAGFLLFSLYLGVQFYRFVLHFRSGGTAPLAARPDGVEAFLPISGLVSLKGWLASGEINTIHPAAMVIFLCVVAVSLLLKRSFCSWICPVATIGECAWKGGERVTGRTFAPPRWLDLLLRGIKYLLLLFFLYIVVLGMPGDQVAAFIASDYNKVADVKMLDFFLNLSGTGLVVIVVLVVLSFFSKNPFCRFVCPYGALLGLVSLLSPVKVEREAASCISCGACTKACPSAIDVMHAGRVHSEECVGCLRCVSSCPRPEALQVRACAGKRVLSGKVFAVLVVAVFVGGTLIGRATGHWHTSLGVDEYRRLMEVVPYLTH